MLRTCFSTVPSVTHNRRAGNVIATGNPAWLLHNTPRGPHGADVKTVQARLRHGSAKTTLDTYGHLWPDKDESTKAVIDAVVEAKFRDFAGSARTEGGAP
jgi:integrase